MLMELLRIIISLRLIAPIFDFEYALSTENPDNRHMRANPTILAILALCLCPIEAEAGKWLDYLRKYDLNDYSLGLAVSTHQSPYVGAENSTIAYPYLTSFEHPALTDSMIVLRDGELGLRLIIDSGWEFAVSGRMQPTGFGNHDSEALRGVSAPKWTIELGPTIGLRRWPVQVHLAAYFEPTDRHDGVTGRLAFSYPVKLKRGYVVPELEAIYENSEYTDYYFGVSDEEETPTRSAYVPGDAINLEARIVWGYELSEKWLLSGKLGYELLADNIQDSPLVGREHLWSVNVGLAYNADVFNVGNFDATPNSPDFEFRMGIFNTNVDTKVGRATDDGVPGDEIDLEDEFGESDNESVMQLDAFWRAGRYHRFEASYFELVRSGSITLPEEVRFGEQIYTAGSEIKSRSHFKSIRVAYAYSLIRDSQKELGVMAGIHFSSFDSIISSTQGDDTETTKLDAPLPVVGAHASANLGEKTVVAAKIQMFRTDYDTYEGSLNYFTIDVQRSVGARMNIGIGYNYYRMKLQSSDKALNGYVDIQHHGPVLFLGYSF